LTKRLFFWRFRLNGTFYSSYSNGKAAIRVSAASGALPLGVHRFLLPVMSNSTSSLPIVTAFAEGCLHEGVACSLDCLDHARVLHYPHSDAERWRAKYLALHKLGLPDIWFKGLGHFPINKFLRLSLDHVAKDSSMKGARLFFRRSVALDFRDVGVAEAFETQRASGVLVFLRGISMTLRSARAARGQQCINFRRAPWLLLASKELAVIGGVRPSNSSCGCRPHSHPPRSGELEPLRRLRLSPMPCLDPNLCFDKGRAFLREGNYSTACAFLSWGLSISRERNSEVLNDRGVLRTRGLCAEETEGLRAGSPDAILAGISDFQQSLVLNPSSSGARVNLAALYFDGHLNRKVVDETHARRLLGEALTLQPSHLGGRQLVGRLVLLERRQAMAVANRNASASHHHRQQHHQQRS